MCTLSAACINIRSLLPKLNVIHSFILQSSVSVLFITETWLHPDNDGSVLRLPGYNFVGSPRETRGGGVGVYIRNCIKYNLIETSDVIEQLFLSFEISNTKLVMGVVYRPPTFNYKSFLDILEDTIAAVMPVSDKIVCCGDFNVDCLMASDARALYLLDFFDSMGFTQLIDQPTRLLSLLDLLLVSNVDMISTSTVIDCASSDHDYVYFDIKLDFKPPIRTRSYRNLNSIDVHSFGRDLHCVPFQNIFRIADVNLKLDFLCSNIINLFNKHAPIITRRFTKPNIPWLNPNLKLLMSLRDKAKSRFRRTKRIQDWNYYKTLRNLTTTTFRLEKRAYFDFVTRTKDNKALWRQLGALGIGGGRKCQIPNHLSDPDNINDFFTNVCTPISNNAQLDLIQFYKANRTSDSVFSLGTVDEFSVYSIIMNIKTSASAIDGITAAMLKLCCPAVVPYITHIINVSLTLGIFPDCWKSALVVPLPKIAEPNCFQDLRPISLLPVLSKVFERVVALQLNNYLSSNNILPVVQSGFRRGYSCETALLKILDDIFASTDEGLITCLVLLDYSKAFDTVNHSVLLSILYGIGFDDVSLLLFKDYLSDRRQSVRVGLSVSSPRSVLHGVPQGSVLGPILFTIYTSHILRGLRYCQSHAYADDTLLYCPFRPSDWLDVARKVNEDLEYIYSTSNNHCLTINPSKSKVLLFGSSNVCKNLSNVLKISINHADLPFVDRANTLGLSIDNTHRYRHHITRCIRNAYMQLKKLYPYRHIFNETIKRNLCETFVLSQFNYCTPIYHSAIDGLTESRIQKVQNSCLRYIYGIRKYEHISHKLVSAGWLNMRNRRELRCLSLYHTILTTKSPPYLYLKIRFRTDVHSLGTRFRGRISPPKHKTSLFERSFTFQIYKKINGLPADILSPHGFAFRVRRLLFGRQCV